MKNINPYSKDAKIVRVKSLSKEDGAKLNIDLFPNFSRTGSIKGMKEKFYGKGALLVKCGNYIYNVTSSPDIYFDKAY